ncbi:Clp protease N-terminal domain-containing protein [Actinomadura formosensis]|uniref:Clp protease N-terminal domain-containing protein n=1 Tax=Actinomadura formosensis TaxID=60706 RepID=UPI001A9552AF|nr:Clp protease N-terminal domain-containing protein [Actinomadura formosensis]
MRLDDLINRVTASHPDGGALVHLSDAIAMSGMLDDVSDQLVGHFVNAAHNAGATWAEIGRTMGMTRQAAQKRFVTKPADVAALARAHDRWTPRAQAILVACQDEARAAGHNYVGTEHIVLALLSQPQGLAAKALAEKTTPERLRAAMSEVFGPRSDDLSGEFPYTPRGTRAIELSVREAQRLGHDYVGTEHILLGVLAEQHGVGAQVLRRLGVDQRGVEEWLAAQ